MKIIIIGCGRLGAGLAHTMARRGHIVCVVDKEAQSFARLDRRFQIQTIQGIGFDREVLTAAGIERADGVAAVTASDEANVVAARVARDIYRVPRVVARLYDTRQAEIYKRLGLQTIAPTEWGVNRIADLLLYTPLETVFTLGSGQVELVEAEVPSLLVGKTVRDVTVPGEIHVVALTRANKTFLPTTGTIFVKDDVLHLAAMTSSARRLKELLES